MARPLRLEYEGAVYHVTSRGNDRGAIFRDDRDRAEFLKTLGSIVNGSRWILHAYCLMGNHYHLLLETPAANLSRGMQRLNGRYTQRFNIRHRHRGHLFQGRFKAILVEKEAHLLELCRYVVLNPVRAKMTQTPGQWPWSSFRATSGRSSPPTWLETAWTLSQFARRGSKARAIYRQFVAEGKGLPSPMKEVWGQVYLGGEVFRMGIDARLKGQRLDGEIPAAQRRPFVREIGAIKRAVAEEFGRKPAELSRPRGGEDKIVAIQLARELTNLTGSVIGREFGVTASQVSHVVKKVRDEAPRALRMRIEKLRQMIEGAC